jgi:hypothetical protein
VVTIVPVQECPTVDRLAHGGNVVIARFVMGGGQVSLKASDTAILTAGAG